jgi:hypothetical protein
MFELDYYTVEELAAKLEKILSTPVTAKDIIHRGIQGKLPIYICPNEIARGDFGGGGSYAHVEWGAVEIDDNRKLNHIVTYKGWAEDFERLGRESLEHLDKNNIYCAGESMDVHNLWTMLGNYGHVEMRFYGDELIRGIPVTLSDLYVLADDVRKLEEECKAQLVNNPKEKELSERKEKTYLSIIGALLRMLKDDPKTRRNQSSIVKDLDEKYREQATSFSKESLDKYFSQANKELADKLKEKSPKQS